MSAAGAGRATLSPAELRTLFLFESLEADQLAWLSAQGRVEHVAGGTSVYREGEPATCFYVLLTGELALSRRVGDDDIEIVRSRHRGAYAGATQAYLVHRDDEAVEDLTTTPEGAAAENATPAATTPDGASPESSAACSMLKSSLPTGSVCPFSVTAAGAY